MTYNRIAVISDYPRLAKRYNVWSKLYRVTHDSWPALFNTKENKRRVKRRDKAAERFCNEVRKEFGIRVWDVRNFRRDKYDEQIGTVIVWSTEQNEQA